jgi:hypothetical protein
MLRSGIYMFTITFEDEIHRQWECEFLFTTFKEAKKYLTDQDFVEKNRLYYRENYNWSKYLKAYIIPKKIYKG